MHAELSHEVGAVHFNGGQGDAERLADFGIFLTVDDKLHDAALAGGQGLTQFIARHH